MRRFLIVCAVALAIPHAVFALSGSCGTLPAAPTLVGGGFAPSLVGSAKRNSTDKARNRLCRAKRDDVVCLYAGPFSSVGEARAVSDLAKREKWDTVILVTSDYETVRAERAFRRCGDFRVAANGGAPPWWGTGLGRPLEWV